MSKCAIGSQNRDKQRLKVADNGWGMFTTFLKYKLEDLGKQIIKIDKWIPSSKTCSNCGNIKENLSLSNRIYHCHCCGITINRDYNVSINIKNQGMKLIIYYKTVGHMGVIH